MIRWEMEDGGPISYYDVGWVIMRRSWDGDGWFPLDHTYGRTRREAIAAWNAIVGEKGRWRYANQRRRGNVLAVRARVIATE